MAPETTGERGDHGLGQRVERLEELAMFGEQAAEEARRSIASMLTAVSALSNRLSALEERIGKWSEIERAKGAGEKDADGVTG